MHLHTPCILAAAIALNAAWAAAPQFDRVFGSHMVLPHGKNVPVSGTADPNKEVTVTFGSSSLKTKADSKGKWSVTLPPMKPSAEGQTLTATQNGDSSKLDDVLVGEVWLASGQSNMLFRLNQTSTAKEDIAAPRTSSSVCSTTSHRPTRTTPPIPTRILTPSLRTNSIRGSGPSVPPPPRARWRPSATTSAKNSVKGSAFR